ncbi:unnamed protein product [Ranitomeya imitator]|uniref:Integrase catalytic domain-containing protein n=1 Tax=Ranitomeya imitator TaxID=111125 RepID=A0ABN9M7V8_9NEOB|nr:unnamed protein product [Ranitomeya imitator]
MDSIELPTQLAIIKVKEHGPRNSPQTVGNTFADMQAKAAVLLPVELAIPTMVTTRSERKQLQETLTLQEPDDLCQTEVFYRTPRDRLMTMQRMSPKEEVKQWKADGACMDNGIRKKDQLVDHITLPKSGRYEYCLVVVDMFSSWPEVFPVTNMTAKTTAKKLVMEVICRYGVPEVVESDQGPAFSSHVYQKVRTMLGSTVALHTPYHPQSSGKVERLNGTLKGQLTKMMQETTAPWPGLLHIRTTPIAKHGLSPYEILFDSAETDTCHNLKSGGLMVMKSYVRKYGLEPLYDGPYQVLLITPILCAELELVSFDYLWFKTNLNPVVLGARRLLIPTSMDISFTGHRALVTGAGKGIGRAAVKALRAAGAEVIALSRSLEDLESLTMPRSGDRVHGPNWSATEAALTSLQAVDLLVNNAGVALLQPFLEITPEAIDRSFDVNVRAAILVSQTVARQMIKRGMGGAIVNVSSQASQVALQNHSVYCATKGALDMLTKVMALELGPKKIRVNCVNPTVIMTDRGRANWSDPQKAAPMLNRIPLGRFAELPAKRIDKLDRKKIATKAKKHLSKQSSRPQERSKAQIQHWNIDKEQGRQNQVELNNKSANELTRTPEGGSPEAAVPLVTTGVNSATEFTTICCNLSTTESTPGQSEDSTCPEEKRGWNPELQKNGETKVAELARLLRANSANGKKDTQSSWSAETKHLRYVSKV